METSCGDCGGLKCPANSHSKCLLCTRCSRHRPCDVCRLWSGDLWVQVLREEHPKRKTTKMTNRMTREENRTKTVRFEDSVGEQPGIKKRKRTDSKTTEEKDSKGIIFQSELSSEDPVGEQREIKKKKRTDSKTTEERDSEEEAVPEEDSIVLGVHPPSPIIQWGKKDIIQATQGASGPVAGVPPPPPPPQPDVA